MATDSRDDETHCTMNPSAALLDNRRWLWVVIYSRLGDVTATEDVLQEVSVAAAARECDFPESGHARSWLYQVAVRQTMLLRRKEYRHRAKLRDYRECFSDVDDRSYIQWLCDGEQVDQIRQALLELKPSDRQVLMLKYCDDHSCGKIAELLGVTETTIQTRLLRARRRLRLLLVNRYEFET